MTVRDAQRFAFLGRVSTEDQQDPEASRNWQKSRATALIEPRGGLIVAEFFDIGMSRSLPWKRRPRANDLLTALADPNRGFDGVVIGEPQRAFYGSQYSLTMPVFTHFDVQLWVPEVGGPIDPDSEAHDLIMSVFGGMSKGERNRIKIRVRTAMASQTKIEGRYLGGRPPYGYQIIDAGPHPHPAKAADGKRLHKLHPHPEFAPAVKWIYQMYLGGRGLYAIAEALIAANFPSPSQADPARNAHRTGEGWSKSAVRVILMNPRYTGRQVWNKQRKQEVLLDIDNVAEGYETKLKWNEPDTWVWSDHVVHEPLVSIEDFEAAQAIREGSGRGRTKERSSVKRVYQLRGRFRCSICQRKMQAQYNHERAYYRCGYAREYALANHIQHPLNVYVRECDVLPALDSWLTTLFAPHNINDTVRQLTTHQDNAQTPNPTPTSTPAEPDDDTTALLAVCDEKLATYRAALEAGVDAETVGEWIRAVKVERAALTARASAARTAANPDRKLSQEEINHIIHALTDIRTVIEHADPADKARVYEQLGLELTYDPGKHLVRAEINLDTNISERDVRAHKESQPTTIKTQISKSGGVMVRVRGGCEPITPQSPYHLIKRLSLPVTATQLVSAN
jgi:site-specific DNA recombinase